MRLKTKRNKDNLAQNCEVAAVPPQPLLAPKQDEPLKFWTHHPTQNTLVDLTEFRNGVIEKPWHGAWSGPYRGRPGLIEQLAPALEHTLMGVAPGTVHTAICNLRVWWRLLDLVEEKAQAKETAVLQRVDDVGKLTAIHNRAALDEGMHYRDFFTFIKVVELARKERGMKPLNWVVPERPSSKLRDLPTEWQCNAIRLEIKREWLKAKSRWIRAGQLLAGVVPADEDEAHLLKNYQFYRSLCVKSQIGFPSRDMLYAKAGGTDHKYCSLAKLNVFTMRAGFFPDPWDVRAAFHTCLAASGWNPATLLGLSPA